MNYMSRHRASEDVSADYKIRESVYLELAKKDKCEYYKMHQHEKDCMDTLNMITGMLSLFQWAV